MSDGWLVDLTDTVLRRAVGEASFDRGRAYALDDRVIDVKAAKGRSVIGTVRGTGGQTYSTVVAIQRATPGASVQVSGRCTCPVAINCKHVAAVLLQAREAEMGSTARHLVAVPDPGRWEELLEAALPAPEPVAAHRSADVPMALQFEMSLGPSRYLATHGLLMRPVVRGRSGRWVRTGVTWRDLDRPPTSWPAPDPTHRMALLRVARESRLDPRSFGAPDRPVYADDLGPRLWSTLDEIVAAGVELVDVSGRPVRVSDRPAEVRVDVTAAEGPAVLLPRLLLDGTAVSPGAVTFLGDPAHGLFLPIEPTGLVLAQLASPVPAVTIRMLQGPPITIPEQDVDRFRHGLYRRLAQWVPVSSPDDTVELPTVEPPHLELRVVFGDGHTAELTWQVGYRYDGRAFHFRLDDPADPLAIRDTPTERQLLQSLSLPPSLATVLCVGGALIPTQQLTGFRTATLVEGLPTLEADGIKIEVVGVPAAYEYLDDDLVITSTLTDSATRDWFDLDVVVSIAGRNIPFPLLFAALATGERQLMLDDGSYFDVARPELHQLRDLIDEAYTLQDRVSRGRLRLSAHQIDLWREFTDLGPTEVQSQRWSAAVDGLRGIESLPVPQIPTSLTAQLRPYQLDGFRWMDFLWAHGLGGVLADDMGLGKTVQTLAAVCRAKEEGRLNDPALVVAPTSVVGNWVGEAARFAPGLRVVVVDRSDASSLVPLAERVAGADVVVTSYALFRIDTDALRELRWSALILDEAQAVKNHRSRGHRCARDLDATVKFAITGTPLENNLMEFWALVVLVAPGLFPSADAFTENYRRPIERGDQPEVLDRLRRRVRPLMLRRTKSEVASDLPAKQEQILEVELSPRHRRIYQTHLQRERAKVLRLLDDAEQHRIAILKSLTLLRRLALHASLIDDEYAGVESAKLDLLVEQLQELAAEGHRALVFSQFTGYLSVVRRRLEEAGIAYDYLDGSSRNRPALVEQFKSGTAPVFLISLKAGGFGLNLTEADYCFVLDPWWNPAAEAQAVDRTHRIGQTRTVMVYRMVALGTIEEKVVELQERKRKLFARVVDGSGGFGAGLSADDIRGLLE